MLDKLSLQRKQMLILILASSISLLLACSAFLAYETRTFRRDLVERLTALTGVIADASAVPLMSDDPAGARSMLFCLHEESHVQSARLYNNAHEVFARYTRQGELDAGFLPTQWAEGFEARDGHLMVCRRVMFQGRPLGMLVLISDLSGLTARLQQYVWILLGVLLASFAVAFALSLRLQRVVSVPILRLAAMARRVSQEKNFALRAEARGQDEVGQLIGCFNDMLGQIQAQDEALRAAHEQLELRVQERTAVLQQEILERRLAQENLQKQLQRISLLNSITRAIADRRDLESLVRAVMLQLEQHLPIPFARVYLYDSSAQMLTAALGQRSQLPPARKKDETALFGATVRLEDSGLGACLKGEIVSVPDTLAGHSLLHRKLAAGQFRAAVAVPLMLGQELFGVLVTARREAHGFSAGDCEFLRMLSEQLALAAHQARLHEQLQKAYDDLRTTQHAVMREERLHALGQMASGIAHDINNALCPIVVFSEFLLQEPGKFDEATVKTLLNIKTAGEDIAHIVSRMREFYRQRTEEDKIGPVRLPALAEQVLELTRPRWRDIPQSRGLTIQLHTDFQQVPAIVGQDSEIREAITNLILNAVDAMSRGGQLAVRTYTRDWGGAHPGPEAAREAVLEVCDTGVGMDEETRKHCLEPFFSTKGQRGTGLGLAMVYGVMERHQGTIEIDSERGQGTTVRLIFPAHRAQPAAPVQPRPAPRLLRSMRVLFVDDEPLLRDMLKQILEHGGHQVELAEDGLAGLRQFRHATRRGRPFDVVITDLGMPNLDGRQLVQKLKSESAHTPVIMLTGWGAMLKENGGIPPQVDGILNKPPKINELYEMLARVLPPTAKERERVISNQ